MTGGVVCPHRPPCPGCPRFGEPGIAHRALATLSALCTEAGLALPAIREGPPFGYRHRARLAVRGRAASPKIGIFQEGSHRIVDIPRCLVHHPLVNEVAAAVKAAVRRTGIPPYADAAHRGLLRSVQVVIERATRSAQVVLVANDDDPRSLLPLVPEVERHLGPHLHSLWWNGNPTRTNVILGPLWHRWRGPDAVSETLGGAQVFYPPAAFGQSNLPLFERLVVQATAWVPDGAEVVELHAGCGAIGLGLLHRVAHVAFNEAAPAGLEGLALGLAARPEDERRRATVLPGPAADHAGAASGSDVVIVDPPRRGLDDAVLTVLRRHPPARLIAVSCNPDALAREARVLLSGGGMRLACVQPYALFPHTAHVETLARFERR
jgi:23S rRNA (uracil1939-C5)-methyltransferase